MPLNEAQERRYLELLQIEAQSLAREKLVAFIQYTFKQYQVNYHHKKICEILQDFIFGDLDRLILSMPPRHGKSEIVSRRLPAFIFGNFPDDQILAASYSQTLASRMNTDIQRIIESPQYSQIFPEVKLASAGRQAEGSFKKNTETFEIVGRKGAYSCAGVGGPFTGLGANWLLVDDPVKNRKEAESLTFRDSVYDWFTSTAYTRLEKRSKILITLTRWHEDDLAGRLLKAQETGGDKYTEIVFPAICEEPSEYDKRKPGEPLWPDKYSLARLEKIKNSIGSYNWLSLYQQRPKALGGNLVKGYWLKRFKHLPEPQKKGQPDTVFDRFIQSWDMNFKEGIDNDPVVGQFWGQRGADFYFLDQVRGRWSFSQTLQEVERFTEKTKRQFGTSSAILVEEKANGAAVISMLKNKIPGILPVNPIENKTLRLLECSPSMESGNVYIWDESTCGWTKAYVDELEAFPNSANDDQVDATSQALWYLRGRGGGGLQIGVV